MRYDSGHIRYPIILPPHHYTIVKLILSKHLILEHVEIQIYICNPRKHLWILKHRTAVRKVVTCCVLCTRFDSKSKMAPGASLPVNGVKETCVFEITGMNFSSRLIFRYGLKASIATYTCR